MWLDHIARFPPPEPVRFACGFLWNLRDGTALRDDMVKVRYVEGDLATCLRCGEASHDSCEAFEWSAWEATTKNEGGGPKTRCWFVADGGMSWMVGAGVVR